MRAGANSARMDASTGIEPPIPIPVRKRAPKIKPTPMARPDTPENSEYIRMVTVKAILRPHLSATHPQKNDPTHMPTKVEKPIKPKVSEFRSNSDRNSV